MVQLPAYAPDLNPVEGAWANLKNGLGNLATNGIDQLATIITSEEVYREFGAIGVNVPVGEFYAVECVQWLGLGEAGRCGPGSSRT